jgi:hypothetical protein
MSGFGFSDEILGPAEFILEDGFAPPGGTGLGIALSAGSCLFFFGLEVGQE